MPMNKSSPQKPLDASVVGTVIALILFFGGFFLLGTNLVLSGLAMTAGGLAAGFSLRSVNLTSDKLQLGFCVVMAVLLGFVSFAVFTSPFSALTLLGTVFAFSFGQLLGMLGRTVVNCTRG